MTSAAVGTVLEGSKGLEGTKGYVKAERLILVNVSGTACQAWLAAMRDAGQPWHEELVDDLAKAKALLQAQPKAHALICYDAPERQIANCIGKDRAPSQALANWMNQIEALLELYREHYQRITLVAQEALNSKPKALFEYLAVRSGIAFGRVTPEKPEVAAEPNPSTQQQSAMNRLLALQALQHPPAQRLAEELEASSLPLAERLPLFDQLDELYDQHRAWLATVPKLTQEEFEQLVTVRNALQAEKALWSDEKTQLTAELEKLRKASAQQAVDDARHQAKLDELQQENDLVIEQLHKTQEEFEQLVTVRNALQAEKALWSDEKTQLTAELEKLRKASAQQAVDDARHQAKLDELQQENDLVIEQLHKVQQELERYVLDERGNCQKIDRLQRDIERKNEKLHNFSQKNKRLTAQLQEVRQQLKDLKQSKSWKITAPLRKTIKFLGAGKGGTSSSRQ